MGTVNKVILLGNLGQDPEIRYTQAGTPVANLNIATNERIRKRDGSVVETTTWHRVVLFGRMAEIAKENLMKGKKVYIEGRISTREYTDKENIKRLNFEVIASELKLVAPRNNHRPGAHHDHYDSFESDAEVSAEDDLDPHN